MRRLPKGDVISSRRGGKERQTSALAAAWGLADWGLADSGIAGEDSGSALWLLAGAFCASVCPASDSGLSGCPALGSAASSVAGFAVSAAGAIDAPPATSSVGGQPRAMQRAASASLLRNFDTYSPRLWLRFERATGRQHTVHCKKCKPGLLHIRRKARHKEAAHAVTIHHRRRHGASHY